jgi:nucleotide-binding universal stress UspA family protein
MAIVHIRRHAARQYLARRENLALPVWPTSPPGVVWDQLFTLLGAAATVRAALPTPQEVVMYKHILIPIDGSSLANTGLEQGLGLARDLGASVTVVTAYGTFHMPSMETVQLEGVRKTYEHQARELARSYLAEAELRAKALGVPCTTEMRESDTPYQMIIDIAMTQGCDLIAMSSHGRSGMAALLLGSQTQKVLAHSTVPVLVYR